MHSAWPRATPKGVARIDHSVSPWGGRADGRTEQDGPVPTYLDLLRHDADTIARGLSGEER